MAIPPSNDREQFASEPKGPAFVDEVDELHEFIDHDTRREPGYVPPPIHPVIPRIEMPAESPNASDRP